MSFATDIGGSAEQQDRAIILRLPDGSILSAVADGHGPYGGLVAQWAMDWITDSAAGGEAPLNAGSFSAIDEHIRTQLLAHLTATCVPHMTFGKGIYKRGFYGSRGLPIRGGTTLSIALVGPDGQVTAAHVGDSNIHVFTEHEDAEGVSLTGDHTPTSRTEFDRIRSLNPGATFTCDTSGIGFDVSYDRPVWTKATDDGTFQLNPLGPFKSTDVRAGWGAYLRTSDDSEGLAMTRALGDFNLQLLAGVITEPHCQDLPALPYAAAGPRERVVVNASDGFWDIVHYAEAAEVIWQAENRGDSDATAAALLALAKAKTLERLGAPGDNITVSVIRVLAPVPALEFDPDYRPGDSLTDTALWEAAICHYCPGDENYMSLGHTANSNQQAEGQVMMVLSGSVPGTGFLYFGRGSTQRIIYRSLDGRYWDIVYRRFGEGLPSRWRLEGVQQWCLSPHGPELP